MCGIVGLIGHSNINSRERWVKEMNDAIIHRGPDEVGWYSDKVCTLAMRRLSVIDLASGKQPIYGQGALSLIFFNGEIYNYKNLKTNLIQKGHTFTTSSDTEVLIHLYEEYGYDMLEHIKGMFAFCIFDKNQEKFFFARDRFGEKPFFYFHNQHIFAFSSEIKSLLKYPLVPRKLNNEVLHYYLTASYVPDPNTLFKDVFSLPPGCFLEYKNKKIAIHQYFEVNYSEDSSIKTIQDAVDVVKPAFYKSVKNQMISDVPLGAFLSGGIDSSAVVASMQQYSQQPIKTFNVRFEEASYDESPIAREVAQTLGTEHNEIVIPNAEFTEDIFWKIIDHVGVPFPDSSAIPTYYITKEIRKEVTVALSGDGGDELFGGYPVFDWYKKIIQLSHQPKWIRKSANFTLDYLAELPVLNNLSAIRQLNKAIAISLKNKKVIPVMLHSLFEEKDIYDIVRKHQLDYSQLTTFPNKFDEWDNLHQMMLYRLKHNLPLDMLTKVDRMSMANSLEVRTPFLDYDLFLQSCKIPSKFLRNGAVGKIVIREMMKNEIPSSVFNHPKSGFSIPLHKYQNKAFFKLVDQLFFDEKVLKGIISTEFLLKIRDVGLNTIKNNASQSVYQTTHQLWSLLQLAGWIKHFEVEIDR